jgi:hypothetical protein
VREWRERKEDGGKKKNRQKGWGKERRGGPGAVTFLPSHETTRFDRLASFNQIERMRKLCFLDLNESETDADSPPESPCSSSSRSCSGIRSSKQQAAVAVPTVSSQK